LGEVDFQSGGFVRAGGGAGALLLLDERYLNGLVEVLEVVK